MPSDIGADVEYMGGVWCEGVLYGMHIIVFGVLCNIFLCQSYMKGRETASAVLLMLSTCMFILSTAHVALALYQLLQGFTQERNSEGGPEHFFRRNIFPKRQAIYIINTLLGDMLLIWRVYVIWGRSWKICAFPVLAFVGTIICGIAVIVLNPSHSVFNSHLEPWVASEFVLNIITQVAATVLIASRIYYASNLAGAGSRNRPYYISLTWVVIESGAIYTSLALVQLITYLAKINANVILELMLAQICAIAPALIAVRVGLGYAYEGNETKLDDGVLDDVVLDTIDDTIPPSIHREKSVLRSGTLAVNALSRGHGSHSRFRAQSYDEDPDGLV